MQCLYIYLTVFETPICYVNRDGFTQRIMWLENDVIKVSVLQERFCCSHSLH